MGSGIAQAAAQSGFYTLLYELNAEVLEKAGQNIRKSLAVLATKGKISATQEKEVFERIRFTNDIHECLADIFIEAIVEKAESKVALFNQLAELNHSESIFATNTSSLSVKKIAEGIINPSRVIGMHFFNPATIMRLVEVVVTDLTDDQTRQMIIHLAQKMGKTPVVCKDSPGFIVNRVARPFYIESLRIVEEGNVSFSQVDDILEGTGFKMGPFRLMDLIGNDINYAVSCSVYDQLGKPERLKPSHLQEQMVATGKLGKKTGEGYYGY